MFRSRLGFADPKSTFKREIRINRGMGILLNGQVVHITDLNAKGYVGSNVAMCCVLPILRSVHQTKDVRAIFQRFRKIMLTEVSKVYFLVL